MHPVIGDFILVSWYWLRAADNAASICLTDDLEARKFVIDGIGGKYIFPIHYHFTTPPYDSSIIKQNYPDAIQFEYELQSWQMPDRNEEVSE